MEQLQTPAMGITTNQQQQNHHLRTDSSLSNWGVGGGGGGGLNAFCWYQIFALDSAVVEVQEMFSSHGGLLTIAMYHHVEPTLIKLTHYDETKKRAHNSQIELKKTSS